MTKKFKFTLEKKNAVKLNLETPNIKKISLKFIGVYNNKKVKFSSGINIKFNKKNLIENVDIIELNVDRTFYNNITNYKNIYTLCLDSSSSLNSNNLEDEIYTQVTKFIKNIKLVSENNNLKSIIFNLKNTNINKIKIKGKIFD